MKEEKKARKNSFRFGMKFNSESIFKHFFLLLLLLPEEYKFCFFKRKRR